MNFNKNLKSGWRTLGVFAIVMMACVFMCLSVSSCTQDEVVLPAEEEVVENSGSPITRVLDYTPLYWDDIQLSTGVMLFKKQNESTYVFEVDLSQGKQIKAYFEFANGYTNASTTIPYPYFERMFASQYNLSSYNWIALINSSFFELTADPTRSPFFLKKNGTIVSIGHSSYTNSSLDSPRKYFAVNYSGTNGAAYIGSAQWTSSLNGTNGGNLTNSVVFNDMTQRFQSYQDVFVGLDPLLNNKGIDASRRRTMVGINSQGGNTVYILVALGETQTEAVDILEDIFSCSDIVMFDGSDSSQFKTINSNYATASSRDVPVFFAIK
jgi:hypothetical protein